MPRSSLANGAELMLNCTPAAPAGRPASVPPVYCVRASPNPEYATQPGNYAHWLLAHLLPLLGGALALNPMDAPPARGPLPVLGAQLYIKHGGNSVLGSWRPRYAELFGVECATTTARRELGWRGFGCAAHLNVSVPAFAFCRRAFWQVTNVRGVSRYLHAALREPPPPALPRGEPDGPPRVVVLIRQGAEGYRAFAGLRLVCEPEYAERAAREGHLPRAARVECASFDMATPLARMARTVGGPEVLALLSGHGAGLANVPREIAFYL